MASFRGMAALILLVSGLAGPAGAAQPEPLPNGGRPVEKVAFPAIADWSSLKIGLQRTACYYRACPAYKLEIAGDGTVTYEGRAFVALTGKHVGHISPEAVRGLFDAFAKADFFWTLDRNRARMTEQSTFTVTIAFDGHSKQVVDYLGRTIGMPAEITELEAAIDAAVATAQWEKPE